MAWARCPSIVFALLCGADAAHGSVELAFSTLLGGSNWDRVQTVWLDAAGDIYLCGTTKSRDFPTTAGAFDQTYNGGGDNDGWVAKLSADGTRLLWSTFLSGSSRDDCYGIVTDSAGNVYVTGWTRSSDFPTTAGAYDRTHNGEFDVFVTKLNPQGTQLVYSTFIGGSGKDQCRGAMAIDATGVLYFAGYTDSSDYPTTAGAVQSSFQGGYGDALIGRVSADGSSLDYSTYLGSSGPDNAFAGMHLHADGSLSVVGLAGGANFPVTAGAYQPTYGGDSGGSPWFGDAFVSRLTIGRGSATVHFTTFLGGNGNDFPFGQHAMAADSGGTYVYASTTSSDMPTSAGAYQTTLDGRTNLYVGKISNDGTALVSGSYVGGNVGDYEPSGVKLSQSNRLLLGGSIFGATTGHPVTADAAQPSPGGADEGFFLILSADLSTLDYSTFVGGSANDRVRDLAVRDPEGAVIVGDTFSANFPTTTGVHQPTHAGNNDGHIRVWGEPSK